MTGNSFELGEVLDKKVFWRPRKPSEDDPKDYSINVFFRTYSVNGDEEKIDIARVDYKEDITESISINSMRGLRPETSTLNGISGRPGINWRRAGKRWRRNTWRGMERNRSR